jgi:hypothetical protein
MVILLKDVLCSNGDEGMRINITRMCYLSLRPNEP